jgi:hypothetical protein
MDVLHNKMMRAQAKGEMSLEAAFRGDTVSKRIGLSNEYQTMELFLKGLLKGMTFSNDGGACKNNLIEIVDEAFNLLDYREIYKPSNTMKFAISINKLSEASGLVYA